jgi:S1-C subfamily serine protease
VSKIDSFSRIAKSGLQVNDVILGVNGTDNVRSAFDLKLINLPEARSTLHVLRDQVELDLEF